MSIPFQRAVNHLDASNVNNSSPAHLVDKWRHRHDGSDDGNEGVKPRSRHLKTSPETSQHLPSTYLTGPSAAAPIAASGAIPVDQSFGVPMRQSPLTESQYTANFGSTLVPAGQSLNTLGASEYQPTLGSGIGIQQQRLGAPVTVVQPTIRSVALTTPTQADSIPTQIPTQFAALTSTTVPIQDTASLLVGPPILQPNVAPAPHDYHPHQQKPTPLAVVHQQQPPAATYNIQPIDMTPGGSYTVQIPSHATGRPQQAALSRQQQIMEPTPGSQRLPSENAPDARSGRTGEPAMLKKPHKHREPKPSKTQKKKKGCC